MIAIIGKENDNIKTNAIIFFINSTVDNIYLTTLIFILFVRPAAIYPAIHISVFSSEAPPR